MAILLVPDKDEQRLVDLPDVDASSRVDKSVLYYDAAGSGKFKVDATWTTSTISDGGNF